MSYRRTTAFWALNKKPKKPNWADLRGMQCDEPSNNQYVPSQHRPYFPQHSSAQVKFLGFQYTKDAR